MAPPLFTVTLVNLDAEARTAMPDQGRLSLGKLDADRLVALLETFRELDPLQNLEAEPEIVVEARREKYLIRNDRKNLLLYNVRNTAEPAYKLSPAEIIAELDGSAASARTTVPFHGHGEKPAEVMEYVPPPVTPKKPPVLLAAVAILLGLGVLAVGFLTFSQKEPVPYTLITDSAERTQAGSTLVGVYMTGSEPGQHGIAVMDDGAIKLFELNSQVAPSVIYDTYRLGRLDTTLCLVTHQPGGVIEARDRDTLVYCGETYQRLP